MTEEQTQKVWTGDDLDDAAFTAITAVLRRRCQIDLGQYKDRCIKRRIAKRLRACVVSDVDAYLALLDSNSDELDTLAATISIHVSQFFRNPDTFRVLESKVIPDLCHRARVAGRREITLWSAGCSSGEEPYSLALLADAMAVTDLEIRVIASDVSEPVLALAKEAAYDATRLKEVPPSVLDRYFVTQKRRFQLVERIRDKVEFFRHNIMTAQAYPQADLILCRNVLIYFTRSEQDRILTRFAQCMPAFGALVLGRSETLVGAVRGYYSTEFPLERVYRRRPADDIETPA
ncbi:MAG: protein-glutamate O-methyltransferase CheR [Desulfuromonadales bacterium]|nr:protein-glutamate O-methyltransferase CheR [Desulfuromonadales bacterium]